MVHHSMGFDGIEKILHVPDLKILIYHNITPPELLTDDLYMQSYAEIGRQQLLQFHDHVIGSIADSPFNAMELIKLGYQSSVVIPLLIDIDSVIEKANKIESVQKDNGTFTVLFVGRVVRSKAQADLVRCFAVFAKEYKRSCRLVLVGKAHHNGENNYVAEIKRVAHEYKVEDKVLITGQITDEELLKWYRAADLYVSMSEHEGFAVPLVEAMVFKVPIIAFPAGAVPWVLNNNEEQLLSSREPKDVANMMLSIATDRKKRANILESQLKRLEYFRINKLKEIFSNYLGMCGIKLPVLIHNYEYNIIPHNFIIAGHFNGNYSLAIVNRQLSIAFERQYPGKVSIMPIEEQPTNFVNDVPEDERSNVLSLLNRPLNKTGPSVYIVNHYPFIALNQNADLKLALFFWEESIVPEETIKLLNNNFDGIIVSSRFVKKVLIDCGTVIPISIVPLGVDHLVQPQEGHRIRRKKRFRFLHVSSCFPRKGVDVLMRTFVETFSAKDPVELVIKTFPNIHNDIEVQLKALREHYPSSAPIKIINRDITDMM
ncbi:MAG: glycosyltransferase [Bacteroidales bacterium]